MPRAARPGRAPLARVPERTVWGWADSLKVYRRLPAASVSALKAGAACPRRFWHGKVLRLRARPEAPAERSPADRGELAHAVLLAFLTPIKGMADGAPKPEGLVSEAALKEIFTREVRRLWRTDPRALARDNVSRGRRRKSWEAMRGWLSGARTASRTWRSSAWSGNSCRLRKARRRRPARRP
ncbi:MAG: PD-(D/E)XK nuclease family protein [Deltaproteobacteria bacterium]|nr:PD-(D/E)XK nuclease family protein [Deltaproteobacteria bacterium]